MNAYLIQDGDDAKVWIAETMGEALDQAYEVYYRENCADDDAHIGQQEDDREYYERSLLESCHLIGEVGSESDVVRMDYLQNEPLHLTGTLFRRNERITRSAVDKAIATARDEKGESS